MQFTPTGAGTFGFGSMSIMKVKLVPAHGAGPVGNEKCPVAKDPHNRKGCCAILGWMGKLNHEQTKNVPGGFHADRGRPFGLKDQNGTTVEPKGPGTPGFPGHPTNDAGARSSGDFPLHLKKVDAAGTHDLYFLWHDASMHLVYDYSGNFGPNRAGFGETNPPLPELRKEKPGDPPKTVTYTVTMPFAAVVVDTCGRGATSGKSGSKDVKMTLGFRKPLFSH
jgi:hypothetical protein